MERHITDAQGTRWRVTVSEVLVGNMVPDHTIVSFRALEQSSRVARTGTPAKEVRAMGDADLLALLSDAVPGSA